MSSSEPINFPYPQSFLRIGGDPTIWALDEISLAVSPKLLADGPAALSVVKPVAARSCSHPGWPEASC